MREKIWTKKKSKEPKINFDYGFFTKKELTWIIIIIIIASFISFIPIIPNDDPIKIITTLFIFTLIIFTSIIAKKITSEHYSIKIEHKIWEFQQWWFYKKAYFKKPFPIGLVFPFILALFSLGFIKPFLFLQFEAENITSKRLLKSQGYSRSQRKEYINEEDLAYTSASGFYALLILAFIGFLLSFIYPSIGSDITKYSIYYGIWNLIPFGQLDGTKLFFGAFAGWAFILLLYLIGLLIIIF